MRRFAYKRFGGLVFSAARRLARLTRAKAATPTGWRIANEELARARDAELPHARLERGPLHPEDLRGPVVAADPPAHALEDREDVVPLHRLERPAGARRRGGGGSGGGGEQVVQLEPVRRRENDGALDDVLQLADVPRPVVARELAEGALADRVDRLPELAGAAHHEVPG